MDSGPTAKVVMDFFPLFRIYEDGRVDRIQDTPFFPASAIDSPETTVVRSKDVIISPQNGVSARLHLPQTVKKAEKLPVLIYIPGGAFVLKPTFTKEYHSYLSSIVSEASVLAVSIDYRAAPEHPIPACYQDCLDVMKWLASHHVGQGGPEPWINEHADLTRLFVAGNGAGANITHNVVAKASENHDGDVLGGAPGVKIAGMILIHPFFGAGEPDGLWELICSDSKGGNDPRLYPMLHPNILSSLVCNKVLVCIAEQDFLRERGRLYYEALKKCGYGGQIDIFESEGGHCFHIENPNSDPAVILRKRVVSFLSD